MGLAAAFHRDDGSRDEPGVDSAWEDWVAASRTYNFCNDDTLIDWLNLYGDTNGFLPDSNRPGYDTRTDFREFVMARGAKFEAAAYAYLAARHQFVRIGAGAADSRSRQAVEATWNAMTAGTAIIAQPILWNPQTRSYGAPDLLVRSDVLLQLFPSDFTADDAGTIADDLGLGAHHYRVVDIKFTTLDLLKDGSAGGGQLKYMVQLWLYNEALGRLQGYLPPTSFLMGRKWIQGKLRGHSASERLARIRHDHYLKSYDTSLAAHSVAACDWVRRVRSQGINWQLRPTPSVTELWPNIRSDVQGWRRTQTELATELEDVTVLPRVTSDKRVTAHASGVLRWTDGNISAALLGVTGAKNPDIVDAVIRANHSPAEGPAVFPERITANETLWREPVSREFYVDFETVSDLDDDFGTFPLAGGQPLIFMIGCGHWSGPVENPAWNFVVFTTNALTVTEEGRVIEEWLNHLRHQCADIDGGLDRARLFHWSPAETSSLTEAYNAAHVRQGSPGWPDLPWCDLLNRVIKEQPVTIRGAFGFGLKAIAKALHRHQLIQTTWGNGPTDGLGAMVGAWWCNEEARTREVRMTELDLMKEIAEYNEIDCKVMAETLTYLRQHH